VFKPFRICQVYSLRRLESLSLLIVEWALSFGLRLIVHVGQLVMGRGSAKNIVCFKINKSIGSESLVYVVGINDSDPIDSSSQAFFKALEQIKRLAQDSDSEALNVASSLQTLALPEDLASAVAEVCEALESFDFDAAIPKVNALLNRG